jgi:hypothetical protein
MIAVHAQDIKEGETLQEVTVKGSKVVQRVDGQTIYPTRQQLESSTNGYSLLSKLTLPHLRIDPVMHTVTALSNLGSVQVRINDIVASKEDLLSLDMKAVKQVDYIDNPGVRYGEGIAYVVNIIVKRPVSGYDIGADLTNTLTASYQMKNITLSLYAQHPFCSNPLSHKTEVLNRYVHKEVTQHSRDLGNMLTLNLTWHLSSGRKYRDIQRTMNHQDTETGILQSK